MNIDRWYPPGPDSVPPKLLQVDSGFHLRVAAMIASLFLLLVFYLLLVAAAGLFAWWMIMWPLPDVRGRALFGAIVVKCGGAFSALLLCLFLFKGLFKRQKVERSTYLRLTEEQHPRLFAFIRRVYKETGSPPPRHVYVSPEVNAALVYNTSLLNLIIPPKKDLLIGLGLVNVLNLSEFKAVMAHEFGHFGQRSIGLGSYLYVANRAMHDLIYGRDALDRFVDRWSRWDVRVSFPAWALKGILWVIRKILAGAYHRVNLLNLALSRSLEYNADNVAVSISGSDALVNGLARLEFGNECLAVAAQSLDAAADRGLFTDDLFYHQTQIAHTLRKRRKDERAGLPPELPSDPSQSAQVFQPANDGIPDKYRSHPTDYMRERNAKRFYLRCPQDDRSPWKLFGDVPGLKAEVGEIFYRHVLDRKEAIVMRPAAEVQQTIDEEHAELTYDPRYHGLYDDRYLDCGEVLTQSASSWSLEKAAAWLANWPPADLQQQVEKYLELMSEYQLLEGIKSGQLVSKKRTIPFRGREITKKEIDACLAQLNDEYRVLNEHFSEMDRESLEAHWTLARHLDGETPRREPELLERYRFHQTVQQLVSRLNDEQTRTKKIFELLSGQTEFEQHHFEAIQQALGEVRQAVLEALDVAKATSTPALANVPANETLYSVIVDRGDTELGELPRNQIPIDWLRKLHARLEGVRQRAHRVHFKSLGQLLAFQERLVTEAELTAPAPSTTDNDLFESAAEPSAKNTGLEKIPIDPAGQETK